MAITAPGPEALRLSVAFRHCCGGEGQLVGCWPRALCACARDGAGWLAAAAEARDGSSGAAKCAKPRGPGHVTFYQSDTAVSRASEACVWRVGHLRWQSRSRGRRARVCVALPVCFASCFAGCVSLFARSSWALFFVLSGCGVSPGDWCNACEPTAAPRCSDAHIQETVDGAKSESFSAGRI
ncbi:LADA_0C07514g1_1 [Lachancea dasiensis]|uniref:LADA_0C07514g1_1 n=1 Tax=Lachancea dasiensis TaxID=1072105 RepID=A0A1G4J066_9SACH|nr:LADA_0C07514g1_1 [Lachancea dasiensis]